MLFKEYCIPPYMLTSANQGIVINKKSSYCKDRANQGRLNQGLTVHILIPNLLYNFLMYVPRPQQIQ